MTTTPYGSGDDQSATLIEDITTAPGATDWIGLSGFVVVQLNGAATAVQAIVERSSRNPNDPLGPLVAPADDNPITGNPSTGIAPALYTEAAVGWWRVRLPTGGSTGGTVTVSISGWTV